MTMGATPVDRAYQLAYVCAYRLMRTYWTLRHPKTHGALVTLWHDDKVLLVKNSYVPYHSLPGGYVGAAESGRDAALRELREEVNLTLTPDGLERVRDEEHEWEGKREHIEIYSAELSERPSLEIDHREVIDARWLSVEEALKLELFPPLRRVLLARRAAGTGAG